MKSNAFNGLGGTEAYSVYGMVYGTSGLVDPKPMELAVGSAISMSLNVNLPQNRGFANKKIAVTNRTVVQIKIHAERRIACQQQGESRAAHFVDEPLG